MRQAKEDKESVSIREFGDFRRYWSQSDDYPEENFGNNHIWMPVSAEYAWAAARAPITFYSKLRAYVGSGPNDGQIDIEETAKMSVDDFHLSFHARWQDYRYDDSNHALVISGNSDKMGGDYSIRIVPAIEPPEDD